METYDDKLIVNFDVIKAYAKLCSQKSKFLVVTCVQWHEFIDKSFKSDTWKELNETYNKNCKDSTLSSNKYAYVMIIKKTLHDYVLMINDKSQNGAYCIFIGDGNDFDGFKSDEEYMSYVENRLSVICELFCGSFVGEMDTLYPPVSRPTVPYLLMCAIHFIAECKRSTKLIPNYIRDMSDKLNSIHNLITVDKKLTCSQIGQRVVLDILHCKLYPYSDDNTDLMF
jgi:hypothetical protein